MSDPATPRPGTGHRRLTLPLLLLLIALAGVALVVVTRPEGANGTDSADAAGPLDPGRALVAALEQAWESRDADAFADLAADARPARRATTATWQALRALTVDRLELRWVAAAEPPARAPPGAVAALVEATWTQRGWPAPATTSLEVVLRLDGPGASRHTGRLLGLSATAGEPAPLWAMAPLDVGRTPSGAVVTSLRGGAPIGRLARLVEAADRRAAGLLPDPAGPLSVVAPATSRQLADLIGAGSDRSGLAAVTTTVDGSARRDAAVQVLLNPSVFGELTPAAAVVVIAHEATHVATGATAVTVPLWVAEGFADFVALRSTSVPVRVAAGRALARVRHRGPPTRLPTAAAFDTADPAGGQAYELAWLAFLVLEQRAGTSATVRFHRAVVAGEDVDSALRSAAGLGVAELTRRWQRELMRLSGARG